MNGSFGYEIRYIRQLRKLHRFHTAHAVLALCFFLNTLFIYSRENLFSNTLFSVYILKFIMVNFHILVFYETF